jgi:hypothetical protein
MSVSFPVLVLERDSGYLLRFDSLVEMKKHLERIDVENGEYLAWEPSGCQISMTVEEPLWLKLELASAEPDSAALLDTLRRFAESNGVPFDARDLTTSPTTLYQKIVDKMPATEGGVLGRFFNSHRRK